MKQSAGHCPDLETIAAYLDGRLTDRERVGVTAHLADCEDCYALFSESARVVDEPIDVLPWYVRLKLAIEAMRPVVVAGWTGTVLATAAALTMFVQTGQLARWRSPDSNLQALVAAVGTDRPIEARLSGFAFAPLRGTVRSGAPSAASLSPEVRIAIAQSEKALAGMGTPEALHTLGVGSLLLGDLDRAIPTLERAVDQPAPDARFLSDLSAAYLARATRDNGHQDLTKALAAADRAVAANAGLSDALFNRALALERLSLPDEARAAWSDYLRVDDRSGWADEARIHLNAVQ
ncbi:MAG TPA: zf-HC2 domain-containing protein [Vicinamibacterales bacterium]